MYLAAGSDVRDNTAFLVFVVWSGVLCKGCNCISIVLMAGDFLTRDET